jgi:predicted esterase
MRNSYLVTLGALCLAALGACGGADQADSGPTSPTSVLTADAGGPTKADGGIADGATPPPNPLDDTNTPPSKTCTQKVDAEGFFEFGTLKSTVRLPPGGTGALPLVIGLHGCGDAAKTFAQWAISPPEGRKSQSYIALSVGGRDGACWDVKADEDKVQAELTEALACFAVDRKKIFIAGYSSGGQLAYQVGLKNAKRYAAILIEHSSIPNRDVLLAGTARPIEVAAIGAINDTNFPPAVFNVDWSALRGRGHTIDTQTLPIDHNGRSQDWLGFLLPKVKIWKAP